MCIYINPTNNEQFFTQFQKEFSKIEAKGTPLIAYNPKKGLSVERREDHYSVIRYFGTFLGTNYSLLKSAKLLLKKASTLAKKELCYETRQQRDAVYQELREASKTCAVMKRLCQHVISKKQPTVKARADDEALQKLAKNFEKNQLELSSKATEVFSEKSLENVVQIPPDVIGLIASFLDEPDSQEVRYPLIRLFYHGDNLVATKCAVTSRMNREKELQKEFYQALKIALRSTKEPFIFPEALKGVCKKFTTVDLSRCDATLIAQALKELIIYMPHLTKLDLSKTQINQEIVELLSSFKKLQYLNLDLTNITDTMLEQVGKCTSLWSLSLFKCEEITTIQSLAPCTQLEILELSCCEKLKNIDSLSQLSRLTNLYLGSCENITALPPSATSTLLRTLSLSSCDLSDLQFLASYTQLQNLDLSYCDKVSNLQPLSACTQLRNLNLSDCSLITDLGPLASCTLLVDLQLDLCEKISDLQPLAHCTQLENLRLVKCTNI